VRETHVYEKVHLGKNEGKLFRIVKTTFILGTFVKGGWNEATGAVWMKLRLLGNGGNNGKYRKYRTEI